jgi:hypothetical protein
MLRFRRVVASRRRFAAARCRGWLALLVCVPLAAAAPAAAQPSEPAPEPSVDESARELFAEGIAFVEAGDWVQAEERFRQVLALRSSHVVAYNLASALVNLGRPVEAAELLRSILRDADADMATRDVAQQLLLQTEPKIGTLTIRVTGDMTGVRFALDEKPLELTAQVQTNSVDPGEHTVTAHRGETPLAFERVTIGGSAALQAELAISLPARVSPERAALGARKAPLRAPARTVTEPMPAEREEPVDSSGGSSFWLWATGGVLVVAAAVVTVLLVSSGGEAAPVKGDTEPGVIRGHVR